MKKLDKLIKRLKKAKEIMAKDDIDDKIKAKMMAEMDRRGMGGKQIADHYRDVDETIPAKQRSNIKNALKQQKIKEQPKPKLAVVKSVEELADELIKSLSNLTKSNYGPKDMGLYSLVDNIKRKENNIGDVVEGNGKNQNVKAWTKGGRGSKSQQADLENKRDHKARVAFANELKLYHAEKKPGDAVLLPAELKQHIHSRLLDKAVAANNPPAPQKAPPTTVLRHNLKQSRPEWDEDDMANALAKIAPLGQPSLQPSNKEFEQAALNSGMAVTQKQADALNKNWGGAIQDFFSEASKPISSRFANEKEEEVYWASIKIADRDNGSSGY